MEVISEGRIEFLLREDPRILAYRRYTGTDQLLVLCNLTGEEAPCSLPQGWEQADLLLSTTAARRSAPA